MEQEKIDRINELARKAKTAAGLTAEEQREHAALRRAYIDAVTGSLRAHLDHTWVVDERGNRHRLRPVSESKSS